MRSPFRPLFRILIGFTLVGAFLSFMIWASWRAKTHAPHAVVRSCLEVLGAALKEYVRDAGKYPTEHEGKNRNEFPALFEALFGEKPPNGRGGPNAPYTPLRESEVIVQDQVKGDFRLADPTEVHDERIEKYLADPWGRPLVYRVYQPSKADSTGRKFKALLYSLGSNGIDETIDGGVGDDIVIDLQE